MNDIGGNLVMYHVIIFGSLLNFEFLLLYDISQDELFSFMLGLSYDTIVAIDIDIIEDH